MDSVPGYTDRNYRSGWCGFWKISRSLLPLDLFNALDPAYLEGSAYSSGADGAGQHGRRRQHAEFNGDPAGGFLVGSEYLWSENRRSDSERLHRRQGFGAPG